MFPEEEVISGCGGFGTWLAQKEWDRARFQGLGVREGGGGMLG